MSPKMNLDDYIPVAQRIEAFYAKHPEGSLRAELLHDDGTRVVMRAYAYRSPTDPHPSTGHAEEIRGDGPVNKTSALENCETSAIGRAIAMLGFFVSKSVASREEVERALEQQAQDNGKPKETVTKAWAEDARKRIKDYGVDHGQVRMKLTSMNVGKLEELSPAEAALLDEWLSTMDRDAELEPS